MIFSVKDLLPQRWWRGRTKRAPQYHRASSALHNLPPEILLDILDWLDPGDLASLALCDKALKNFVAPSTWTKLKLGNGYDEARRSFLRSLARDDGRYFLCHECLCLHSRHRLQLPATAYIPNFPLACIAKYWSIDECYHCFRTHEGAHRYSLWFPYVQLAMARHLLGPDHGFDLATLAVTEVACILPDDFRTLLSVEPGIIEGELCMRVQQWFCFPSNHYAFLFKYQTWDICTHIKNYLTVEILECKLQHADNQQACHTCYPLLSCILCNVEFSFNLRTLKNRQMTALVVSKWINFGSGETRADPNWRRKTYHIYAKFELPVTRADEINGICARFERQHSTSVADQTEENASLLQGNLFPNGFTPVGLFNIWARHGQVPT